MIHSKKVMTGFDKFCVSSYLTFRYVVREGASWKKGFRPAFPHVFQHSQICVRESAKILEVLRDLMKKSCPDKNVGILLSGGIDSAILAALMPPDCHAYTVRFMAEDTIDESQTAEVYAEQSGLNHHTVQVTWNDYLECMDRLMLNKKSPLHPVEVGLFKAACAAMADGVGTLVIGNGADSTFGGMDKLLSKDWTFDEFVNRYTFVNPARVVKQPLSMLPVYEEYRIGDGIDVVKFLKVTHGLGIIQAFDNAIGSVGCKTITPYEHLFLDAPLDLSRIRNGQSKYLLRSIFKELYPELDVPVKIPFVRPMDQWLKNWSGPQRPEFLEDINLEEFSGEQRWLLYCLERFMNLVEQRYGQRR
jgi:hypothetical protein